MSDRVVSLYRRLRSHGMPLWHRHLFWLWFVLLLAAGIGIWACVPRLQRWEVLAAIFAGCWGVMYFLRQQHLEEAKFFKELFLAFTARYDDLNDDLLNSLASEETFDEQKFVDYFNLCAEEWLFYRAGYIYRPVWKAWYKGMKQFSNNRCVADLWQRENQTESYYGFEFPVEVALPEEGATLPG